MSKSSKLTAFDCFLMAAGMTIGSGIITMTGFAIGKTGSGVFLAYVLASLCIFFGRIPYVITGSVIPTTSGAYVYSNLFSPKLGAAYLYVFFIGRITMAFLGTSFASYLASIVQINETIAAVGILTILYLLNLFGLKSAAKIQNLLTILLIIALLSFVILGIPKVNFSYVLQKEIMFTTGWEGMVDAISVVIFGVGGAFMLIESGSHIQNPQKLIPRTIFLVTFLIGGVFFGSIGLVASGILPIEQVANQPLTLVAKEIYVNSFGFAIFIIGGALLAIITTANASYSWYYNAVLKGCTDGWFPKSWGKKNKYGTPYILLTIFWLIGIVPILLGMDIQLLSRLSSGLTLASLIIPGLGILSLPKKYPEQWKASKFYMSETMLKICLVFSDSILLYFIYRNFKSYPPAVLLTVAGLFIAAFIFIFTYGKKIIADNHLEGKYDSFISLSDSET